MLDPTIVGAIINASGGIVGKLIELAGKSEPNDQAKKVVEKTYDKIASVVTTNSVRVLIALRRAGSKQSPGMVWDQVEPERKRQEPNSRSFEADLEYRLRFLCLLGLVQRTYDEYAITHLGKAFLAKASEDTINYTKALI